MTGATVPKPSAAGADKALAATQTFPQSAGTASISFSPGDMSP